MDKSREIFDLASFIDHTALKPTVTDIDVVELCKQAVEHRFATVCIPPIFVKTARKELKKSKVGVCTVIGFPLGYNLLSMKLEEGRKAIKHGADEIDVVMNISDLKSGRFKKVKEEMEEMSWLAHDEGAKIKYIIETAYLSRDEMKRICSIAAETEIDYIKTSTGFANIGAVPDDIKFLRSVLPKNIKIKASGGIKTYEQAFELVNLGADRIGTSSGIEIINNVQIA